jgi:succinate dehydrogenase/fumarate reductase cytochrome b subunit
MRYWFLNAFCGLLLLFLLGAHLAGLYLGTLLSSLLGTDLNPLAWAQVSERGESILTTVTYVLFLGTALFHGFYGLHTMLVEFWPGRRAARIALLGCWSAGLVLFLIGTVATVSFFFVNQSS